MQFELRKYVDEEGLPVITVLGECPKCKRGPNTLILFNTTVLSPSVLQHRVGCISCKTKYNVKQKAEKIDGK